MGRRGIGLIHYADEVGRKILIEVATCALKADMYARFVSPSIGQTFGNWHVKEMEGGKRLSRPDKYAESG